MAGIFCKALRLALRGAAQVIILFRCCCGSLRRIRLPWRILGRLRGEAVTIYTDLSPLLYKAGVTTFLRSSYLVYEDDETFWSLIQSGSGSYQVTVSEETTVKVSKTSSLKVKPKQLKDTVEKRLKSATLGLHILTRKDILRYITAEAGRRAKAVMSLLNLSDIEKIRSDLVTMRNDANGEHKYADNARSNALSIASEF